MDVLKPPLVYLGNRCYRKNPLDSKYLTENDEDFNKSKVYSGDIEHNRSDDAYCDEVCDPFLNIEETSSGFQIKLDIPSVLFKFLIGKKGETKRRLEHDTCTQIRIPRQGQEGPVVVVGRDKKGVVSAKNRIDILMESARQKQPFTHFLSIPIYGTDVRQNFDQFKEDVLRFYAGDRGIDGSLFQGPSKLHLTLGTLQLLTEAEVKQARDILQQCQQDIVGPILNSSPLQVQIKGLEYMNDDPNAVDVLYAKIQEHDGGERLQSLADGLVEKFTNTGLMQREYDRVKLHITAMNTRFRNEPSSEGESSRTSGGRRDGKQSQWNERVSFDASNILKNYGDYDFGAYTIQSIHLSIRYSTGSDEYYKPTAVLDLPT